MRLFFKIAIPVILKVIILLRIFVGEVCTVSSGSMYPTIITGDRMWINKTTYGARLPRRFSDIPLLNVFTLIKPLREADEKIDWGNRRLRGKRMPRVNDLAVFESPIFPHPLLVKRITETLKAGDTLVINTENFDPMYKIVADEGRHISLRGDSIFIDGQADSTLVLSQPYYYMLGDNRNNSIDSRSFGYIPHSSVVGRMNFIIFSINTNRLFIDMIRWDRMFKKPTTRKRAT